MQSTDCPASSVRVHSPFKSLPHTRSALCTALLINGCHDGKFQINSPRVTSLSLSPLSHTLSVNEFIHFCEFNDYIRGRTMVHTLEATQMPHIPPMCAIIGAINHCAGNYGLLYCFCSYIIPIPCWNVHYLLEIYFRSPPVH